MATWQRQMKGCRELFLVSWEDWEWRWEWEPRRGCAQRYGYGLSLPWPAVGVKSGGSSSTGARGVHALPRRLLGLGIVGLWVSATLPTTRVCAEKMGKLSCRHAEACCCNCCSADYWRPCWPALESRSRLARLFRSACSTCIYRTKQLLLLPVFHHHHHHHPPPPALTTPPSPPTLILPKHSLHASISQPLHHPHLSQ